MKNDVFKKMVDNLIKININYKNDIKYIRESIKEDNEFGRLASYLLNTERDFNCMNLKCNKEDANEFANLLHNIHHALVDDGELTFYTVNGAPRLSVEYDFSVNDGLNYSEKHFSKDFKYECKILKVSVDEWIKLSEEFYLKDLIQQKLFDEEMKKHFSNK